MKTIVALFVVFSTAVALGNELDARSNMVSFLEHLSPPSDLKVTYLKETVVMNGGIYAKNNVDNVFGSDGKCTVGVTGTNFSLERSSYKAVGKGTTVAFDGEIFVQPYPFSDDIAIKFKNEAWDGVGVVFDESCTVSEVANHLKTQGFSINALEI